MTKHERYNRSAKGKARARRYEQTNAARLVAKRANNRLRVMVAARYLWMAETEAEATAINAHIKQRLHAFIEGQRAYDVG